MKKHILFAAVATLALAPTAYAQNMKAAPGDKAGMEQTQLRPADENFVKMAAIGNMFEIQSSELADDKAQGAEVKTFAKQMIRDHGKTQKELEKAVEGMNGKVPSELDTKHAAILKKLETADEASFDRMYIQAQRDAHREAVSLYSTYSKSNGALSAWAAEKLPVLQEHAQHVQQLSGMAQGEGHGDTGRAAAEPMHKAQ